MSALRHLVIVLGDQLDAEASAFDGFDPACDVVWMAELDGEARHVWSAKARIALFLASMRHFAQDLARRGWPLRYTRLDDPAHHPTLSEALSAAIESLQPQGLVMTAPGEWRVLQSVRDVAQAQGLPLDVREDRHFYSTVREFAQHARGRKSLRMEHFYREMRRRHGVLMERAAADDGQPPSVGPAQPLGGRWNFDTDNRESFDKGGPGALPAPRRFAPDAITREVLELVSRRFAHHPGALDDFDWPVTREQALAALDDFVDHRLAAFGRYQDALWPGEPWLYHARLSAALNLKLIHPREAVARAEDALRRGRAPLASVEGFVRQILGWREYVRGVYWTRMPDYAQGNALEAEHELPAWFWDGRTDMACLGDALRQTLRLGYAHHIQRLMVIGTFALLYGVRPQRVHEWFLAVYVDAVEWVELPNTLGMSQYADGGLMASKPYAATGKYIERMSAGAHCAGCRYDPARRTGERACPYTTLYWDFLHRHRGRLAAHPRMALQVKNLERLPPEELDAVQMRAQSLRRGEVGHQA